MSLFKIIDHLGPPRFAKSVGIPRASAWRIRHGVRGISVSMLARVAGRYPELDLRETVREMFPDEYGFGEGLHTSEGAPADPHTPEAQREEVSP